MAQVLGPYPLWESWVRLQAPGFGLAQLLLLPGTWRSEHSRYEICLCLSNNKLKHVLEHSTSSYCIFVSSMYQLMQIVFK